MTCLFCEKEGPYSTVEHIVPESLGNKTLLLNGMVCDGCQSYFGKEIEAYVLSRSPIGAWRVMAGIPTKHGKRPIFSFRQPKKNGGRIRDRHPANDDFITLIGSPGRNLIVELIDERPIQAKASRELRTTINLVMTPKMLHMIGRFLGKVGLEMLARDHCRVARQGRFDRIRRFARFGEPTGFLWPIFYGAVKGGPSVAPTEITVFDTSGLIKGYDSYTLSSLRLGTEFWVICLSDPYPHPVIRESFPGVELKTIAY